MKQLPVILIVLLIVLGVFAVFQVSSGYVDAHKSAWQVEASAKAVMNVADYQDQLRNEADRRAFWTDFYQVLLPGIFLVACAAAGVYVWKVYDQRKESWARAVDGTFALQTFSNGQVRWQVDPNKQLTGTTGFQKKAGALGEFSSAAGHDRQLAYNLSVQKTRTATAMIAGDSGPKYAAHAKLMAGAYDRNDKPALPMISVESEEINPTWQVLSAQDAFAQSDPNRWILGQSPATGELFELNPKESAHFGVVGATGAGKTVYTALMLMAYAMRNKYRVSILDGKGGADWSKYQDFVEYSPLDYSNVAGIIGKITSEYEKRQAILNQHGVNSIWELPKGMTIPRPTLFIVDEFGAVMDSLKAASRNAYKSVELDLGNLLRLSRGAGLYVVLCDQNPSKWPGTIRANMPMNICYRLGGNIGNAVNEYSLDKLNRVGQFQVSNTVYNAFPTYQVIDDLLSTVDYKKPKALLTIDGAVTGYGKEGGVQAPNPTPQTVTVEPVTAPVTGGYTRVTAPVTEPVTTLLTGAPVTDKDKSKVRNIYAVTGSKSETCRLVWGGKNGQRMGWLNEVLASEVQQ